MRKIIINFNEFINESKKLSEIFNDDEIEILSFLIHDKGHVLGRGTEHEQDPILDSVFDKVKSYIFVYPLWRGIYSDEKQILEDLYTSQNKLKTSRYISFSESKDVALSFSKRTKTLIELIDSKGLLNYHQFIREVMAQIELEINGKEGYDDIINMADKELEHIMNIGTTIQVIGKRQEGDITIYTIKQV